MTSEELAAIRARAEAATPGEWKVDWDTRPYQRDGMPWCTFAIGPQHGVPADPCASAAAKAISRDAANARNADATFIAHARQDVPRLCDEVARLTAEVERLSAMVPRWEFDAPIRGELIVGECRIGSVVRMSPGDWSAWATDGDGAAWLYVCRAQTAESACAAVCRRLGLPDIKPPTEDT